MTDKPTEDQAAEVPATSGDRHKELDAAWEEEHAQAVNAEPEGEEPEEEEEPAPEPEVEEPEPETKPSHEEKSRLGRKVKRLEDALTNRDSEISGLREMISELKGQIQMLSGKEAQEDPSDPSDVLTVGDLQRYRERWEKEEEAKANERKAKLAEYGRLYRASVAKLEDSDPDIFEELENLLTGEGQPYNKITTGDPELDVRINAAEAKAFLLSGKSKQPRLKQQPAKGTKVGGTEKVKPRETKKGISLEDLDPQAKDYYNRMVRKGRPAEEILRRISEET